jgi:hypothetical protein
LIFDDEGLSAYTNSEAEIDLAFQRIGKGSGCGLVSCDFHQKIRLATGVVKMMKSLHSRIGVRSDFALLINECDVVENRSAESKENNEREMEKMKRLSPIVKT